jgi:hypothetical protein
MRAALLFFLAVCVVSTLGVRTTVDLWFNGTHRTQEAWPFGNLTMHHLQNPPLSCFILLLPLPRFFNRLFTLHSIVLESRRDMKPLHSRVAKFAIQHTNTHLSLSANPETGLAYRSLNNDAIEIIHGIFDVGMT